MSWLNSRISSRRMLIWLFTRESAFWFDTALYSAIASTPMIAGQSTRSKAGCAWPNGAITTSNSALEIRLKVDMLGAGRLSDRQGLVHDLARGAHDRVQVRFARE